MGISNDRAKKRLSQRRAKHTKKDSDKKPLSHQEHEYKKCQEGKCNHPEHQIDKD